ncbi:MAG: hypothetical protein ACFFAS_10170 [Promethearchaeota archaeon]
MTVCILLVAFSSIISSLAIGHIIANKDKYYLKSNTILFTTIYLLIGIVYPLCYYYSLTIREHYVALHCWILMVVSRMVSLGLIFILFSRVLSLKKFDLVSALIICFLTGLIIAFSYSHVTLNIPLNAGANLFDYGVLPLPFAIIVFDVFIAVLIFIKSSKAFLKPIKSSFEKLFLLYYIAVITFIGFFLLFIIIQGSFLGNLSLIFNFSGMLVLLYIILKYPNLFISYTNRIYDFIIFQKSGVLLYSYNFDTKEETDDAFLKGSILIGINHIISNIINKKQYLNLIQVKDRDIIFEYDKEYGYALLLITRKKNIIIEKATRNFIKQFNEENKETLIKIANLSQLIDTSEFSNVKRLIYDNFKPFIMEN